MERTTFKPSRSALRSGFVGAAAMAPSSFSATEEKESTRWTFRKMTGIGRGRTLRVLVSVRGGMDGAGGDGGGGVGIFGTPKETTIGVPILRKKDSCKSRGMVLGIATKSIAIC